MGRFFPIHHACIHIMAFRFCSHAERTQTIGAFYSLISPARLWGPSQQRCADAMVFWPRFWQCPDISPVNAMEFTLCDPPVLCAWETFPIRCFVRTLWIAEAGQIQTTFNHLFAHLCEIPEAVVLLYIQRYSQIEIIFCVRLVLLLLDFVFPFFLWVLWMGTFR